MRQVIAIGGGGFGRTQASNLIEQYILDQASNKSSPSICFIPTATGDLDPYVVNFYSVFSKKSRYLKKSVEMLIFIADCTESRDASF